MAKSPKNNNLIVHIRPLQRVLISIVPAVVVLWVLPHRIPVLINEMAAWLAFSFTYLFISWTTLFVRPIPEIKEYAKSDDGSKWFVFVVVLLSSFSSFITVLLLMTSKEFNKIDDLIFSLICVAGIVLSWLLVHTTYTFHYAHEYYNKHPDDDSKDAKGLVFPGDEEPDYIDFAYFAFVIGCCFQVSDVTITSRTIRRTVLLHQLLSFALNTFVVALTINLIAGLMK